MRDNMYSPDFNSNANGSLSHRLDGRLSRYEQHYNYDNGRKSNASSTTEDAWSHSSFGSWCEDQSNTQATNIPFSNSIISSRLHTAIGCSTDLEATKAAFTQFYVMDNTQHFENNMYGECLDAEMADQTQSSRCGHHNDSIVFGTNSVESVAVAVANGGGALDTTDISGEADIYNDVDYTDPLNNIINQMNEHISIGPIVSRADPVNESMEF